jgi:hypothetical protein
MLIFWCIIIVLQSEDSKTRKITYIVSILSVVKANKPPSKQKPKIQSICLSTNEPWDWMKAQILAKVSITLNPHLIEFNNYDVMFFIPCNLPKPGLTLSNDEDYAVMTNCAQNLTSKDPTINLTVIEKERLGEENKENTGRDDTDNAETQTTGKLKLKEKNVRAYLFGVVCANCSGTCRLERILPPSQRTSTKMWIFRHCAKDGSARSLMCRAQGHIVTSSPIQVTIYLLVMNSLTAGPQPAWVSYFRTTNLGDEAVYLAERRRVCHGRETTQP